MNEFSPRSWWYFSGARVFLLQISRSAFFCVCVVLALPLSDRSAMPNWLVQSCVWSGPTLLLNPWSKWMCFMLWFSLSSGSARLGFDMLNLSAASSGKQKLISRQRQTVERPTSQQFCKNKTKQDSPTVSFRAPGRHPAAQERVQRRAGEDACESKAGELANECSFENLKGLWLHNIVRNKSKCRCAGPCPAVVSPEHKMVPKGHDALKCRLLKRCWTLTFFFKLPTFHTWPALHFINC